MDACEGYITRYRDGNTEHYDIVIICLSSEPLLNWGRNFSRIWKLWYRVGKKSKLLLLVPEALKNICLPWSVVSGKMDVDELKRFLMNFFYMIHGSLYKNQEGKLLSKFRRLCHIHSKYEAMKHQSCLSTYYYWVSQFSSAFGVQSAHMLSIINYQPLFERVYCEGVIFVD
ncbi:hypothetical protein ACRDO3_004389 [Escherichia coli]